MATEPHHGGDAMNHHDLDDIDRHVCDVYGLLQMENLEIAGDVAGIRSDTWVIHGVIPYDGEVIVAEFETYAMARAVLDTVISRSLSTPV
jgi:hypothetical protein